MPDIAPVYALLPAVIAPWAAEAVPRAVVAILKQELQINQPKLISKQAAKQGNRRSRVKAPKITYGLGGGEDVANCPLVNVELGAGRVRESGLGYAEMEWTLYINLYAAESETADEDMTQQAGLSIDYLARGVWATIESEQGVNALALSGLCRSLEFRSYTKSAAEGTNQAVAIMSAQMVWEFRTREEAPTIEGAAPKKLAGNFA